MGLYSGAIQYVVSTFLKFKRVQLDGKEEKQLDATVTFVY